MRDRKNNDKNQLMDIMHNNSCLLLKLSVIQCKWINIRIEIKMWMRKYWEKKQNETKCCMISVYEEKSLRNKLITI